MEDQQFDELTKRLATPVPRRFVVKAAIATAVGGLLSLGKAGGVGAAPSLTCTPYGRPCASAQNSQCCNGYCTRSPVTGYFTCLCPGGTTICEQTDGTQVCVTNCTGGQQLNSGTCTCTCGAGTTLCNGVCRNLSGDPNNCGTCGNVCATGQACLSGTCVCANGAAACPSGTTGGPCLTCTGGQVPTNVGGVCKCACPAGTTFCNGECVAPNTSVCGSVCCAAGSTCVQVGGTSTCCPSGSVCGTTPNGLTCCKGGQLCQNGVCTAPGTCGAGGTCGAFVSGCQGNGFCYCFQTTEGMGVCSQNFFCSNPTCTTSADCAPGFVCTTNTCCGGGTAAKVCAPICGTGGAAPTGKLTGPTGASL